MIPEVPRPFHDSTGNICNITPTHPPTQELPKGVGVGGGKELSKSHHPTPATEFADIEDNYGDLCDDKTEISPTSRPLLLLTFHVIPRGALMRYLGVRQ